MNSENAINREGHKGLRRGIISAGVLIAAMRVARLLVSTLREIFDEAAYARFLGREGKATRETYAAFVQQREAKVVRRPRCC